MKVFSFSFDVYALSGAKGMVNVMNKVRLKDLREQSGKSQRQVALALGIDRTTYVKYEQGISNPNAKRLSQLAKYFGVSIDYLMHDRECAPLVTPGESTTLSPDKNFDSPIFSQNAPISPDAGLLQRAAALFSQMSTQEKEMAIQQIEMVLAYSKAQRIKKVGTDLTCV